MAATVDEDRLGQVREHMTDSSDMWNILLAQSDRKWLLEQVEILRARVKDLESERAVYNCLADQILQAEDERILNEVGSNA